MSSSEGNVGGRVRGGDYEGPSSSRMRYVEGVWPEPFVEALATHVAVDASLSSGRLAAAPALFNLFQVCSTWRAVSRSELLWQNLTRTIWNIHDIVHDTWQDEYIYRHRTAQNFRLRRCVYSTLNPIPSSSEDENDNGEEALTCSRLVIYEYYLATGYSDGSIRLFHLLTKTHIATFHPQHRDDRLGRFSPAVSGIILSDTQLIFASLNGDVHVASIGNTGLTRRTELGDVVRDGALVDFSGCNRWWVGLYAGVPGRAFHVWNAQTEELFYVGGTLTDPEAVMGWHQLTDLTDSLGRVRTTSQESAFACTSHGFILFDLSNPETILGREQSRRGLVVGACNVAHDLFLIVDSRGSACVRRANTSQELCRFNVRGPSQSGVMGCMNQGYVLMCAGGVMRVWGNEHGGYLYRFTERLGGVCAMGADNRHVAVCTREDTTIHLWDFGAQ